MIAFFRRRGRRLEHLGGILAAWIDLNGVPAAWIDLDGVLAAHPPTILRYTPTVENPRNSLAIIADFQLTMLNPPRTACLAASTTPRTVR